jgi:hypothetical protein
MELIFGIGALWGVRTDVAGLGPHQFAVLQNSSIDFDFEEKDLYSQLGFPIDAARGKGKVDCKAEFARVFAALYADLFFGETAVAGEQTVSQAELFTVPAGGVYTVANSAAFLADLGVYVNSGGQTYLGFTTGAPSSGQYSTAGAGLYTFNTGQAGIQMAVSYVYTVTSTGFEFTIHNNLMGYTPTFQATLYHNNPTLRSTGVITVRLNTCISRRLSLPTRVDEYTIPGFDFSAIGDGSNIVGVFSSSE